MNNNLKETISHYIDEDHSHLISTLNELSGRQLVIVLNHIKETKNNYDECTLIKVYQKQGSLVVETRTTNDYVHGVEYDKSTYEF